MVSATRGTEGGCRARRGSSHWFTSCTRHHQIEDTFTSGPLLPPPSCLGLHGNHHGNCEVRQLLTSYHYSTLQLKLQEMKYSFIYNDDALRSNFCKSWSDLANKCFAALAPFKVVRLYFNASAMCKFLIRRCEYSSSIVRRQINKLQNRNGTSIQVFYFQDLQFAFCRRIVNNWF